ncbi:hypothetical protein EIP91_005819 [Steccherinum ochraceum]|uniref:Nucleoporin NDC1 n=1 Tax=Steccherinum ochraceum TaxID=92696 RepID=A0A4R0RLQ0_9APHY|nr:hypothetical protein EIP91_005819 [Steccherinum ochraceum]
MSAPGTPIRAITNSLSLRSTPAVPPASQTYEPLVKAVLRHRLVFRIFLFSSLFTWAMVVVYGVWIQGGITRLGAVGTVTSPIRPTALLLSVATWGLGVLPVLVLRKTYLAATPTVASSPSQVFKAAISKTSTIPSLIAYIATSATFTTLHLLMSSIYDSATANDSTLTLFVKSKKHPYYLNGRTLYIVLAQLTLSILFLSRNLMLDRLNVRWTASLLGNNVKTFRLAQAFTSTITMVLLTALSLALHTCVFGLGRSLVLPIIFKLPVVSMLIRPFAAHFLRGPLSFTLFIRNWALIRRAYALGLFTTLNWEFAETVFDTYVAEPLTVSHVTADPSLTLTSGISSTSTYIQHFAFSELRTLASDASPSGSARRIALFSDQKYNPTIWATLVRTILLVLGNDYQTFLRKGAPEPKVEAPKAAISGKQSAKLNVPSTPLVKTNVLKASTAAKHSPLKSALETLAADGVVTAAADEGAAQLPELFRSIIAPVTPQKPPEEAPKPKEISRTMAVSPSRLTEKTMARVQSGLNRYAPSWVGEVRERIYGWWTRERLSRVVEGSLPNRKVDALAVESICALTCASLDEDRFGVVQRDIPRIIESLISFLLAIESQQASLQSSSKYPTTPEEMAKLSPKEIVYAEKEREELVRAGEVLSEVGDALKAGLVHIAQTFGHRLAAFKFPPRIANKLQGFVDYS